MTVTTSSDVTTTLHVTAPRSRIHAAVCRMLGDIANRDAAAFFQERNNKRTTNHGEENYSSRVLNSNQSKRPSFRAKPVASRGQCFPKNEAYLRDCREYLEQNFEGDTRLHIAVVQQLPILVSSLVRAAPHQSCLDVKNNDAQTALHVAVLTRQADVASWLLEAGADSASRDRRGNTALHLACQMGDMNCVKALTKRYYRRLHGRDSKTLEKTCQLEDVSCFKALTNSCHGRDSKTLEKPCQMEVVKTLTKSRDSQDAKAVSKHSPMRDVNVPIKHGQVEDVGSVKALTNHSLVRENAKVVINPCHEGTTARSQETVIKVPKYLSKKVVTPCQKRNVRCIEGTERNEACLLPEELGDREISPRELALLNFEGETCAHVAANNGHVEALRWLIQCGADPDARDGKSGNTVLHIAVERRIDSVSRYLLDECNVDLETRNYAGLTAYDLACDVTPALAGAMARRGATTGGRFLVGGRDKKISRRNTRSRSRSKQS